MAIIPEDEFDASGQSSRMLCFVEPEVVLVNKYDEPFRSMLLAELENSLNDIEIVELPWVPDYGKWKEYSSACGRNLDCVVTNEYVYLPVFGFDIDNEVVNIIREYTTKQIVTIDASEVCSMGAGLGSFVWLAEGETADRLIEMAKTK